VDVDLRCSLCRNAVDAEDLFCANCGREVPAAPGGPASARGLEQGLTGFDCRGCGASTTYDAGAQALRCAFCGSTAMEKQPAPTGRVEPAWIVPFKVSREDATAEFRRWLGKSFWRPFGLENSAALVSMEPVFVPCWRFAATTDTHWAADSSKTPAFARASWCPVGGHTTGQVEDVLVLASGSLSPAEVEALQPFRLPEGTRYERGAAGDVAVEDFGVSRRGARPEARRLIEAREAARCEALVPASARNVHVNVLVTDLKSEPVLVPVWINAYRWKERVFRFLVNGQTGEIVGRAPRSALKFALALLAVALVVGGILLIASR
jgi:LSD1 subclass zinc finger protein